MSTRIYLPATLPRLAAYVEDGSIPAEDDRFVAPGEDEESEYAALTEAAEASRELIVGTGRRVVVVAEVEDVDSVVAMREVVAVHVDTEDDWQPDDELGWFATQEIPDLLSADPA